MYRPLSVRGEQCTEGQVAGKTTLYLLCIWFRLAVLVWVPPASSFCAVAAAVATARSLQRRFTTMLAHPVPNSSFSFSCFGHHSFIPSLIT